MYYSKCNTGYVLRAEVGEEVQEALRQFAEKHNIKGAFYQGIGALTQVELAFFSSVTKTYDRHFFADEYELISLMGNISLNEGSAVPHTHVSIGDNNFQTYSGHLVRGTISVTAEIFITPIDLELTRKEDPLMKYRGLVSPKRTHLKVDV